MRSHDVRTDAGGEKKIASIPYIPMPYRQETFGSWIWRCSRAYCTSRSAFMRFILATAGAELIDAPTDWDTDPPLAFLTALTSVAPLQLSELTNLVVLKGPATLAPAYRDAYCPQCFREDEVRGTIHMRRAWLDAWTIECPRHECILGRFSGFECKDSAGRITNFPTRFGREPTDEGQVRDNPVVCEVPLPHTRSSLLSTRTAALSLASDGWRRQRPPPAAERRCWASSLPSAACSAICSPASSSVRPDCASSPT